MTNNPEILPVRAMPALTVFDHVLDVNLQLPRHVAKEGKDDEPAKHARHRIAYRHDEGVPVWQTGKLNAGTSTTTTTTHSHANAVSTPLPQRFKNTL